MAELVTKKMKKRSTDKIPRNVDNTRGTHLWGFNHYRTRILTSLLNDITALEKVGLNEEYCKILRNSLDYLINAATSVPEGGLFSGKALYKEIEEFHKTYTDWNDINGENPEFILQRRKLLKQLRRKRQNISNKIRLLQYELDNNLDQKLLEDSYKAIGELIKLVPNVFKNLSSSYSDYLKRSGKVA